MENGFNVDAQPTASGTATAGLVPRLQTLAQIPLQQKISLMVVLAVAIALGAGAWMWSSTPDYRVLHANLAEREGGAVIAALQQMNVPYKFIDGALMVPAAQLHEARMRLASQGLPRSGGAGFELMENQKLGASQFVEQINYQRALEGELARSIQSLGGVHSARVHLALSRPSAFLREQPRTSASVLVNLHPGRSLDAMQVAAIAHLISHSVPGLPAKNVSIVDHNGALLSGESDGGGKRSLDPGQIKFQQELEQTFLRRVESILAPVVGAGNVRAQVSAEIDFTETEQAEEIYKPNQRPSDAAVRSQQTSESSGAGAGGAGGVPGALTNQAPAPATAPLLAAPGPAGSAVAATAPAAAAGLRRDSTVNYEVDKSIRHVKQPMGRIKRLSVAVVVNHMTVNDAKGKPSTRPLPEAQLAQLTELVQGAVGYNKERGDVVSVVNSAFKAAEPQKVEELPLWKNPEHVETAKSMAKHLLIGGLALFLLLGILRPALRTLSQPPPAPALAAGGDIGPDGSPARLGAAGYDQSLHNAKLIARQDPKVVANVVKEWVNGNG